MEQKSQQVELLSKLLKFYKSKFNGNEVNNKFDSSVKDLIETGDVDKDVFIQFCKDNNMTIQSASKRNVTRQEDPCGRGGYSTSHC